MWLCALIPYAAAYRLLFDTSLPFPSNHLYRLRSLTQGKSTGSNYNAKCQTQSMGDGKCDGYNNNEVCSLDGGDCCRRSCIEHCYYKSSAPSQQLPTAGKTLTCLNACGSRGYDCETKNAGCSECYHGTCRPIESCYESDASVLQQLDTCRFDDLTMGNYRSVDIFCGKDVNETFVHDPYNLVRSTQALHYPGCGLSPQQCTYMSCCSDAIANEMDSASCTDDLRNLTQYSPLTRSNTTQEISCLDMFRECFRVNAQRSFGQCCECQAGWTAYDCNTPICSKECVHGSCKQPELCVCEEGWQAEDCNTPKCKDCLNGACIDVDVCRCFYGWSGSNCRTRRSHSAVSIPDCVHGHPVDMDKCQCDEGYTGRICDIREE